MKVRMAQEMSGSRADGSRWPPVGEILDTSDEEGMLLCASSDSNPFPMAVPVVEHRKVEHAAEKPDPKVETRTVTMGDSAKADDTVTAKDPIGKPADPPAPQKRPGRPRNDSLPG